MSHCAALHHAPELVDVQPLAATHIECSLERLVAGLLRIRTALLRGDLARLDGLRRDGQRSKDRACKLATQSRALYPDRAARRVKQRVYLVVGDYDAGCEGGVL